MFFSLGLISHLFALDLPIPPTLTTKVALTIMDASTNQVMYNYRESVPMRLASNMKIITSYVALDQLGPDFSWPTKLAYDGTINQHTLKGNVYLIGGGDPTLSSRDLEQLLSQLRHQGITTINGDFILDSSIFNHLAPNSELHPEPLAEYSVEPNGLLIDSNLSELSLSLKHHKITVTPKHLANYRFNNQLHLNPKSKASCDDSSEYITLQATTAQLVSLSGTLPPSCNGKKFRLNLLSTLVYNQRVIQQLLQQQHDHLSGRIQAGIAPSQLVPIYTHNSATLQDILPQMNKFSNNMLAKTLFLSLGAYRSANQNTYSAAQQIYRQTTARHWDFSELAAENGAGLSRQEQLTTQHMAQLLYALTKSPNYTNFMHSLPTPNESGTLAHSFSEYRGRLYAKTGTLEDTKAYSGYFMAHNGHTYILSLIANDITNHGVNSELDQFKQLVATSLLQVDALN